MKFKGLLNLKYAEKYRDSLIMHPEYLPASAWKLHVPFAFFLMGILRPSKVVELGTYWGASFFAFCQAAKKLRLVTGCYAVDTWEGDSQTGSYSSDVYDRVCQERDRYPNIAYLKRKTFDQALGDEDMRNIDLLHIDGLHTYEAVRHDFQSWLPRMSSAGVILFHDTEVRDRDFGVWRLWEELAPQYPSFNFKHGHGLGVLLVGDRVKKEFRRMARDKDIRHYEMLFNYLGMSI